MMHLKKSVPNYFLRFLESPFFPYQYAAPSHCGPAVRGRLRRLRDHPLHHPPRHRRHHRQDHRPGHQVGKNVGCYFFIFESEPAV